MSGWFSRTNNQPEEGNKKMASDMDRMAAQSNGPSKHKGSKKGAKTAGGPSVTAQQHAEHGKSGKKK